MTLTWNTSVFTQERSILRVTDINASTAYIRLLFLSSSLSGTVAKYTVPNSRELDIDLSDAVRLDATGNINVGEYNEYDVIVGSTSMISWSQAGLINPNKAIIPLNGLMCKGISTTANYSLFPVVPPSKIYIPATALAFTTIEVVAYQARYAYRKVSTGGVSAETAIPSGRSTITLTMNDRYLPLYDTQASGGTAAMGTINLELMDSEKDYVPIRWVSRFGTTKIFYWEMRDLKTSVNNSVSIENLKNQYDVRKGYVESLTAHLDNLDAYDYWYYADIITSSKVEVLIGSTWYQVEVTSKDYTVPNTNAGKPNTLDVKLNFRKYDTL